MFSITRRRLGGPGLRTASNGSATSRAGLVRQASGDFSVPIGSAAASGSQQQYTSLTPVTERLERGTVAHDWIPRDTRTMNRLVRLLYLTDPVAGPAIDFYREVPFGPVILGGIKDERILQFYNDALDAISLPRHLPFMAGDILVDGRLIVHLLLSESKGYWNDLIIHDSDYILVEPSPILGEEPTIDLMVPPSYQRWAINPDPRIVAQRRKLDPKIVKLMAAGSTIPLSPENTIFVPRKVHAKDDTGTSLLMRILPVIAVEWSYLTAEVTGLRRRAAPWTIAKVGIEDKWEPTPEEMMAIQDMMVAAEEDPAGAKLVFRTGVDIESTSSHHGELAKWIDNWSVFKEAKLQGLGMNEAFATGEASWCLPGNALISTSNGLLHIRDIPNWVGLSTREARRIGTISLKGSGLQLTTGEGEHTASSWAYSGKKLVKRVTTDMGYTLEGTDEHPVLILTSDLNMEWTQIKNLKQGDVIALRQGGSWPTKPVDLTAACGHAYEAPHIAYRRRHSRNLKEPKLPSIMSNDLACILGHLVAEGDCTDRDRVIFGNSEEEVLTHYKKCHHQIFPDQHLSISTVDGVNAPFTSMTTGSWIVREFLYQIGLPYVYSVKKDVPWSILQSPKAQVAQFLSSLFEGDGGPTHGIEYTSYSRKLVFQVQQLLLKFNILAKVERRKDGWRIRIFGRENIQRFISEIDFISSNKREGVRKHLKVERRRERQRWTHLGGIVRQRVTDLLEDRKKGTRYVNPLGDVVCANVRKWRLHRVSPEAAHAETMLKELKLVDPSLAIKIKRLWDMPYVWVGVNHIGKLGTKHVYDLCVPEHESYVANGFVVHNSYLESMLSLGMERIRNFRQFIAVEVIREGLLAPLAKMHGFYKRSQAELDHHIRTMPRTKDNLAIPTVEWSRSLQPTADRDYLDILEMLEGKGMPIPLRKWAQAGGYDIDEALGGMEGDIDLRKQLADYNKQVKAVSGEEEEGADKWGNFQLRSGSVAAAIAELPVWTNQEEFLALRRGELSKLSGYVEGLRVNGKKPGIREWKKIEARMKDDGIHYDKIRTFRYMLSRAGIFEDSLPIKTVVRVRDAILKRANGPVPDRNMMREIYWLNLEMEKRNIKEPECLSADVLASKSTAPWVRPATPKLLTGEGYKD